MSTPIYYVSVREAIDSGKRNLKYIPAIFAIFGLAIPGALFLKFNFFNGPHEEGMAPFPFPIYYLFVIAAGCLLAGFIWKSCHSAAWKIWALENVQDAHRLYQVAESNEMIYGRDHWLNNLEYKSGLQRSRLADLETRLDEPRQLEVPGNGPRSGETEFVYSMNRFFVQLGMVLAFFGYAFYISKGEMPFPLLIGVIIFAGFTAYKWVPRLSQPAPIRLDETALTIQKYQPVPWEKITNIFIDNVKEGKTKVKTLVIESQITPPISFDISDINSTSEAIEETLYQYWVRGKQAVQA